MTKRQFFWTIVALNLIILLAGFVNEFYIFCPTLFGVPMTHGKWLEVPLGTRVILSFSIAFGWLGILKILDFLGWKFLNKERITFEEWRTF
ncbi:MAG: hypothetical protein Q7S45_00115 [Candidatus Curtissbacteria bacterium]|nr:hypothetical protein [Candidatus Curtissbacteria bacterium]